MKPKAIVIALASLILIAAASSALACPGCWGPGWRGGSAWSDLKPEQQKEADALRLESLKKSNELRRQIESKQLELMELSKKDRPDQKAIDKAEQELWNLEDALRREYRTLDRKLMGLLTLAQRRTYGLGRLRAHGPRHCGWGGGPGCPWARGY